jgi:alpha-1,2-mannosyltransferase
VFGASSQDDGVRDAAARIAPVAVLVAVLAAVTWWIVARIGVVHRVDRPAWLLAEGGCWLLFAAASVLLVTVPRKAVPALVLGGALLIGLGALAGPPTTSTDSARYAWDGIVQDAGISPYRYVPADPALAPLRTDWLFPAGHVSATGVLRCPVPVAAPTSQVGVPGLVCTAINRPLVPTIYPPVAEAAFAAVRLLVPPSVAFAPMQVLGLVAVLATTALLLGALRITGRDPRRAAWFAWCPLVASEAITNAHIDGLAALGALAGTLLVVRGRPIRGGIVLGLAVATKVLPVLVLPPLLKRSPVRILVAAAATVVAVYVPHVVLSGGRVLGYLPGYLNEEGYDDGTRSALVSLVAPGPAATPVAALLLLVVAVVVLLRTDPADPWVGQVVVIGSALLLTSPRYSWYALLLVPFVAMSGRWEWFALPLVLIEKQFGTPLDVFRAELAGVLLLVAAVALVRRSRRAAASRATSPVP